MKNKNKIKCCAALFAMALTWQSGTIQAASTDVKTVGIETTFQKGEQRTITGLLVDTSGEPIIGATVMIERTTRGVTTDINGKFSIKASTGESLEFRFIGYITTTRKITADTQNINVVMEADAVSLDDVVVIGYGQQKKESVVSSMASVGPAELSVKTRSLTNNIAGKVSGLIAVQRSGEPGWDDAQFWIRGVSSYAGGTSPLVLVDGVPRKMNDIDVDEIESFSVLKDAAATAVYGAEGANGVVLITSKRGKAQKTVVNMSAQYGIATPTRLPNLMDSYNYLSLYNEASWNDKGNPSVGFVSPVSDDVLEKYRTRADSDLYPNTDWMDMLKDHTSNQRYTINFRGGGEKVRFFVSGAYYHENGIYKDNPNPIVDSNVNFERYNLRSNIDFDLSRTTRMSVDMSGQYINRKAPSKTANEIFNGMTLMPVHLIPMIYSDGTPAEHPDSDNQGLRQNPYNYLYYSGYSKSWEATVQSKVTLEQDLDFITKGLSVKGVVGFDARSGQFINRTMSANSFYALSRNEDGILNYQLRSAGSALSNPSGANSEGDKRIYLEASLNYKNTFNKKHDVTAILLYNQKDRQLQNASSGINLLPYRKQSIVARTSYGYDGRYMLEGSFGITGSENFAEGHRWGIFPAVGAAWFISHEKWFEPLLSSVNKLKFRASFGITGNDDVPGGRFPYLEVMNESAGGINLGIAAASNGNVQNWMGGLAEQYAAAPLLKWEIERKINTGFDLGLFKGRVDMSVDYFSNRRKDILMNRTTIPSMTGLRNGPRQNFGIVTNKGIDGNITIKEHFGKLNVTLRGNFTYTKNEIVECDEITPLYEYLRYTGHTINTPVLYIAEGLYTPDDFNITRDLVTGAESYTLKEGMPNPGAQVSPGDIKYKDLNKDGVIDGYDRTYSHNVNSNSPKTVYGIALDFEYKGFFAGVFFQGAGGCSVNLMSKASNFMPFNQGKDASSARMEAMSRWTVSNPYNQDVLYPRMHSSTFSYNLNPSTWWYRDASFIRLKNIEFGYQFNKKQLKALRFQNLRLYIQGSNLAVWDDVKYWDPELGDANSGARYPLSRTWIAGVEVTF
ncbi:SusC/RagA family TonB-linked outer membrane protein [Bacteroides sp. UBA939]|uniref:SusC/RagA family TonB-linked outer membrane protein n=1 Tax=Bacteroides sp. UBA939 TaxID=1946092 RepID=UPI0025C3166A|nr:TonB-dependent receptor [Bacteroides sp. UBA939]